MDLDGALDGGKPGEATPPPRSDDKPPGASALPPVRTVVSLASGKSRSSAAGALTRLPHLFRPAPRQP